MALGEQVAFDDDGGQGYNSHLQWMVPDGKAGRYWIYLSEASSATAHQEVLRDDDGAGNLDSHLYWITQQEGGLLDHAFFCWKRRKQFCNHDPHWDRRTRLRQCPRRHNTF